MSAMLKFLSYNKQIYIESFDKEGALFIKAYSESIYKSFNFYIIKNEGIFLQQ